MQENTMDLFRQHVIYIRIDESLEYTAQIKIYLKVQKSEENTLRKVNRQIAKSKVQIY